MSEYHAALMRGPVGAAADELTEVVLEEFDKWAETAPSQAAGVIPNDAKAAARFALNDVREELVDYLPHALALVLASWGVGLVEE